MFEGAGEIPYIKVYNLTFDGTLDFTIAPTYITKRVHEGDLKRSRCLPGDVLMNIVGPPLGKVSVVPESFDEWNINQAIARFRPVGVQPAYLSICLRTPALIAHAASRAKATAGQFNLTLEICRDLPGARQATCRLGHAANGGISSRREAAATTESRSGLSVTVVMCVQSRVWPDQRAGLRSRAWR